MMLMTDQRASQGEAFQTSRLSDRPEEEGPRNSQASYYRARYYNPVLQRFISEDPIGFSGGDVNLYAYTGNSPTNLRDPSGKIAPLVVGGVLCGTGAAIGGYYYYKSQQTAGRKTTFGGYAKSALAGCGGGLLAGLGIGVAVEAAVPGIALAGGEGVFYSGLGAAGGDLASAYAAETGAASISETFAGTALNAVDSVTSALGAEGSLVGPAWEFFSAQFAEGAGSAVALVGEGISAAGTYATVELPILLNNGVIPFLLWP
jgi:RHS repeat-associated protein